LIQTAAKERPDTVEMFVINLESTPALQRCGGKQEGDRVATGFESRPLALFVRFKYMRFRPVQMSAGFFDTRPHRKPGGCFHRRPPRQMSRGNSYRHKKTPDAPTSEVISSPGSRCASFPKGRRFPDKSAQKYAKLFISATFGAASAGKINYHVVNAFHT